LNVESILERVTPTRKERSEEMALVERVFKLLNAYPVKPILVGSLAKDTDLANNKDIDIFIQFPQDVPRADLEKQALKIGKEIFNKLGVEHEIDYAEHPYVKGSYEGNNIEIVPCYEGAKIMSAVDRTPHHTQYVSSKIKDSNLNSEIRLLKQFMRGIGVYGAEAKVEGFSGYLVELLVIRYGSFNKVLEAARSWNIPEVIDLEGLWDDPQALPKFFTEAELIVVDPVDKSRNVAAAVSSECLSKLIVKSDEYIHRPSEEFFFPKSKPMRTKEQLASAMVARKSKFMAVVFKHEKINANTLYSQMRKTAKHLVSEIEGMEFTVFKNSIWTNEKGISVLLLEFEVWTLPNMVHHLGPPVTQDASNQEKFNQKYALDKPYVKDGRWVVDTKRRFTEAKDALKEIVSERKGFGKNLRELEVVTVLEDEGLLNIGDAGWLAHINEYLD